MYNTFQRKCDMRKMTLINKRIAYHITRRFSTNSIRRVVRRHIGTRARKSPVSTLRDSFILHSAKYQAHSVNRVTPVDSLHAEAPELSHVQSRI